MTRVVRVSPGPNGPATLLLIGDMIFRKVEVAEATSDPPRYLLVSGWPIRLPGVWQAVQPMIVTSYLPRSTCASAACTVIGAAASPIAKVSSDE
jgi:hypothetical protein